MTRRNRRIVAKDNPVTRLVTILTSLKDNPGHTIGQSLSRYYQEDDLINYLFLLRDLEDARNYIDSYSPNESSSFNLQSVNHVYGKIKDFGVNSSAVEFYQHVESQLPSIRAVGHNIAHMAPQDNSIAITDSEIKDTRKMIDKVVDELLLSDFPEEYIRKMTIILGRLSDDIGIADKISQQQIIDDLDSLIMNLFRLQSIAPETKSIFNQLSEIILFVGAIVGTVNDFAALPETISNIQSGKPQLAIHQVIDNIESFRPKALPYADDIKDEESPKEKTD